MDRYVDKRKLPDVNELDINMDDLKFFLNPCASCSRNPIHGDNCYETCRYVELWQLLIDKIGK